MFERTAHHLSDLWLRLTDTHTYGRVATLRCAAEVDAAGYLTRLGLDDPGPPSVSALRALHRAHLERVPYGRVRATHHAWLAEQGRA